ncbi:hypothetical protein PPL_08489 [Heterostelium album PN500]|uniref:Uncharacterized protein n=1 Tax=Heterostelium pallidum (strain ATCC 26659 / Pp 5 / PN500) TaxID=670386 RepID=D3BIC1_HETP5|nr:hypothetical protein PPL_08489 [Heterostelium album PN500]EFA79021.1 hypothetical protein PPL_08489 [Heterostelium album PN500]|eukprot:XP_020431144.1 hypothetical protein PPL_08489 [Heterostelium album PN500]
MTSTIAPVTKKVTQYFHPVIALIGLKLPADLSKNPRKVQWSDQRPQIHNLMFALHYPQSDVCKQFEKHFNLSATDLSELKEKLKPLQIIRRTFEYGSTHRRDYWAFYQTKIIPGTPKTAALFTLREEKVDQMVQIMQDWVKDKKLDIHIPFSKPYLWTFEVEHDSRVIDIPVRDTPFFRSRPKPSETSSSSLSSSGESNNIEL